MFFGKLSNIDWSRAIGPFQNIGDEIEESESKLEVLSGEAASLE